VTLRAANAFIAAHHRTHKPARGCRFCIGLISGANPLLCGVLIAGRPVARALDDGVTLELLRVCTDGTLNACSKLLGAARRAAAALGYLRVITYTLPAEGGASLRAAGFDCIGATRGGEWSRSSRIRPAGAHVESKWRWQARV
jgi:hypothetical protein